MFVGKSRGLSLSGAPERSFTLLGSGLTRKIYTWLERLPGTNTLACYENPYITAIKSFIGLSPAVSSLHSNIRLGRFIDYSFPPLNIAWATAIAVAEATIQQTEHLVLGRACQRILKYIKPFMLLGFQCPRL